ncbi:hypothetical protein SUGI_0972820 [Cryptomeria japonica]|nr:hypothetical protein SUGI_0972820 [Cryptomeria japonica]
MKRFLKIKGARNSPKVVDEEALGRSLATKKQVQENQIALVSAVLIATVAFQAAFTLPEKYGQSKVFFIFVLCDSLAFSSAIATTLLRVYAANGNQEDSLLVNTSLRGLWIASSALVGAFISAVCIFIYSKHRGVGRSATWMVFCVFQVILIMIYRSKSYTFSEEGTYVVVTIIIVDCVMAILDSRPMSAIWTTLLLGWYLLPALKDFGW